MIAEYLEAEHNGDECCVPYDTAVQREQDAFDSGFGKAIDRVLEIVDTQVCCGRLNSTDFRIAVLALKGEGE